MIGDDLTTRTPSEREEHLKFFTGLSLKELRYRQDLCHTQIRMAYNQHEDAEKRKNGYQMGRMEHALRNLREMENDLMTAVGIKSFGKKASKRKTKRKVK